MLVFLTFTSCGLDYRNSLPKDLHNRIKVFYEDDQLCLLYQEEKYICVGNTNLFDVDYPHNTNDVLLSWNGHRYIGYIDEYYSNTTDNPVFIYNQRVHDVFFHEDYDYMKDIFLIENTNAEIVWENVFGSKINYLDFMKPIEVVLYSKQCPRIKIHLKLVCVENQWYLSLPNSQDVWVASNEFIETLSENGII